MINIHTFIFMGKMIKKIKNEKIMTKEELTFIKNEIADIEDDLKWLEVIYKEKAHDEYYFTKSIELGNKLKVYQNRLKRGLKTNKALEKRNKKC